MLTNKLMGGSAAVDPNFANVSLLLHGDGTNGAQNNTFLDSSPNNFTITKNGNATQGTFSPFTPTAAYSPSVNGGSGYFDGNGDYLSVVDNTALNLGTGNFTIEGWIYANSNVADLAGVVGKRRPQQFLTGDWRVAWDNDTSKLEMSCGLENILRLTPVIPKQSWAHFAFTRSSGTLRCYANGVIGDTDETWSHDLANSEALLIGRNIYGYDFSGYIPSLRILKGTALYTGSTYTVPTAPLTAITNTSLLLNFTNGGIIDNAMRNDLETVGNAQISTSVKKYGTGSMAFDGSGDALYAASSTQFAFGTGGFTIEAWFYVPSALPTSILVDFRTAQSQIVPTIYIEGGGIGYYVGGAVAISATYTPINSWAHVAVARSGTSTKLFVNGAQVGSTFTDSNNYIQAPVYIGNRWDYGYGLNGYIDDLRITKGVARYTANFTPPTQAFPDQ